jgi:hypothetical protein
LQTTKPYKREKTKTQQTNQKEIKLIFLKFKGCYNLYNVLAANNLYIEGRGGSAITTKIR